MYPNHQQQYPPQQYAPPPQNYAPAPYQQAPQGYGMPPQQNPYGMSAVSPQPFVMPNLNDAGGMRGDGTPVPSMRNLLGRVVAMQALAHDPNAKGFNAGEIRPNVRVRLIVFDGPVPLQFGDRAASNNGPARGVCAQVSQLPAEFASVTISNGAIVNEVAPYVPTQGWVFGLIRQGTEGTKGNPPILIDRIPDDHPVRAILDQTFAARHADPNALMRQTEPINGGWEAPAAGQQGGYPGSPPPNGAPAGLPPQVNYGAAPMAAPPPAAPAGYPQGPAAPPLGAPPAQAAPKQGADGGWYAPPPQWPAEAWAQLNDPAAIAQLGVRVG